MTYGEEASLSDELRPGITACIASHPGRSRNGKLTRALASVSAQHLLPEQIIVGVDKDRRGAGWNRQQILSRVDTEWMAWLDSDDEWYPQHLRRCAETAQDTGAWFVFPWFDAPGDPLGHFGLPFNPAAPHHTTITFLVRTELARVVGFNTAPSERHSNEDWHHLLGLCEIAVARDYPMVHLPERTWYWHMDGGNSSGLPGQGDAQ